MKKVLDLVLFTLWLVSIVAVTCITYNYCHEKADYIDDATISYIGEVQDEIHENGFENIGNLNDYNLEVSKYGYDLTYKINGYTVKSHYNGWYSLEACEITSVFNNVFYFVLNIFIVIGYCFLSLFVIYEIENLVISREYA